MNDETQSIVLEGANAMPATTWRFLNMNDAQVAIPANLSIAHHATATVPAAAQGQAGAFEQALHDMQQTWELAHPAPTPEEIAERAAVLAAEADATYGGTAQSAYQKAADALEESRSLAASFSLGVGDQVAAYLLESAGDPVVIHVPANERDVACEVAVSGVVGAANVVAIDLIAEAFSQVNLSIVVDGASSELAEGSACAGVAGTVVRVLAQEGAHVNVTRVQTLDDAFADFDALGVMAADQARVNVKQTVLGSQHALVGMGADLRGSRARIDVDTRYLGSGQQVRDFNYLVRHHGQKTISNLDANGVLAGKSQKTLRGTIDLIRGCKESEGSERETVLLVDEHVRNRTVPIILCNEDDVAGNHGATIGHIRPEQLFYLASRGLSPLVAERLFAQALVEQAALEAVSEPARAAVVRLACSRGMDADVLAGEGED